MSGTWTVAWAKRTPWAARASRCGVLARETPIGGRDGAGVATQVIGPRGVQRDQQQISVTRWTGGWPRPVAAAAAHANPEQ